MHSEAWHAPRHHLMLPLRQSENAHDLAANVQGPPGLGNAQAETHGTKHLKQFRYIHGGSKLLSSLISLSVADGDHTLQSTGVAVKPDEAAHHSAAKVVSDRSVCGFLRSPSCPPIMPPCLQQCIAWHEIV